MEIVTTPLETGGRLLARKPYNLKRVLEGEKETQARSSEVVLHE